MENFLISMPGASEWLVIFICFALPLLLVIFVVFHLSQQTKLLKEIRDEIKLNNKINR